MHKGNQENFFDRFDYVFTPNDALHVNVGFTRSWFQTPNSTTARTTACSGPDGQSARASRSALEDSDLQYRSFVDAHHQHQCSFQRWSALCAAMTFNYYRSDNPFADLSPIQSDKRCAASHADECRSARQLHLHERHSQH